MDELCGWGALRNRFPFPLVGNFPPWLCFPRTFSFHEMFLLCQFSVPLRLSLNNGILKLGIFLLSASWAPREDRFFPFSFKWTVDFPFQSCTTPTRCRKAAFWRSHTEHNPRVLRFFFVNFLLIFFAKRMLLSSLLFLFSCRLQRPPLPQDVPRHPQDCFPLDQH